MKLMRRDEADSPEPEHPDRRIFKDEERAERATRRPLRSFQSSASPMVGPFWCLHSGLAGDIDL